MITKPRNWQGRRLAARPLLGRPEIAQRQVTHIRMLKKAPYKVSYADFTYSIQPVELPEENVSYIAARMLTSTGRLAEPLHEYELTKRFPDLAMAGEAWSAGFAAREDLFVSRAIIDRLIDEEAAEVIPTPPKPVLEPEPEIAPVVEG